MNTDSVRNTIHAAIPAMQFRVTVLVIACFALAVLGLIAYGKLREERQKTNR